MLRYDLWITSSPNCAAEIEVRPSPSDIDPADQLDSISACGFCDLYVPCSSLSVSRAAWKH
ncbi:hypothetical protein ACVWYH_002422 [Bradyrhizobium sp. GM24.11]